MLLSKFMKPLSQRLVSLLKARLVLLCAPGLTKHPTHPPFTHAQFAPNMCYGIPALAGRQYFPFNASLRMSMSSSFSAKSFLSRAFSLANSLSCLASCLFIPPYL